MKYTLLAYVSTLILFLLLMYFFGWQIANWLNNLAANWGCQIGEYL